jgi:photosystem II stability/assembly factor-like uncharacterized protein
MPNRRTSVIRAAFLLVILIALSAISCAQQIDPAFYSGMRWRNIGPFRGGRAITAAGVKGQPGLYYFGSVGGGVWKTTDAGNTWDPIFDSQNIASIGAVTIADSDPNVLYVGSGEADMRSQISFGDGVYKSTDAGKTWTHLGLTDTRQIGRIIVHPTNPNIVFVAALGHQYGPNAERGVFRSTDGGKSWQKVLYKDPDTGAIDLAFEPGNPSVIYASMWNTRRPPWNVYPPSYGPGSGLYKSTDGGNTWTQLQGGLPTDGLGRMGIAVAPAMPNRVYVIADAKQGGVYRSDDSGKTFQLVGKEARIWGRGWYFCGITADPTDPNTVFVANTSLYRSTDAGQNWTAIKGAPGGDDYHFLWVAPDDHNRMILASDQGVVVTLNAGKTWSSWYNQPIGQFYRVITDNRFPYWAMGPQQDSGAYAVPTRSNSPTISDHDWRPVAVGGESGELAPDPLHPGTIFGGTLSRYDWTTGQNLNVSPTLTRNGPWRRTWTLPVIFSTKDPRKLYMSHQQLFRSIDSGNSWDVISPDLTRENPGVPPNLDAATATDVSIQGPRRGVIYSISPSPLDANLVWVGTDDGLIHVTHDDGKTWQNITPPALTPWSKVAELDASHFDASTAYAAVDRHRLEDYTPHIYRTRDGGKSWQEIVNGLPKGDYVNVVREDPARKGLLYAGTELGVYVTFDDGETWQPLQINLPHVSVRDIAVHEDDIVIATHGRALWVLDDVTPLRQLSSQLAGEAAHLFAPAVALRVRPGSEQFEGTPLPPEIPQAQNPPPGAILDYSLARDVSSSVTLEIVDGNGQLVRRYSSADTTPQVDPKTLDIPMYWIKPPQKIETTRGMHRFTWDLRYQPPASEGGRGGGRRGGAGVLAVPGQYTVKLTVEGQSYTQPLTLKPDPRIQLDQAAYQRQFEVAQQLAGVSARAGAIVRQADAMRRAASDRRQKVTNDATKQMLAAFLKRLDEVAGAPMANAFSGEPESGAPEQPTIRVLARNLQQLYGAVESADAAPTSDVMKGLAEFSQQFTPASEQWQGFVNTDLPKLNQALKQAGAEPIPLS